MVNNTNESAKYPDIRTLTLAVVPTNAAAHYLNRQPQTLRVWACYDNGPLRPLRINGRLAWAVSDIKRLLGVGE